MKRTINIWSNIDWITIAIYLVLVLMGWLNIYSAVYDENHGSIFDVSQKYGKQMIWISAAIVIAVIVFIIDSNFYSMFSLFIYGLTIFLLITVLLFGKEVNGARSWFEIGSIRLQPAEFAKFATCMAIAKILSMGVFKGKIFLKVLTSGALLFIPAALIILQNDTGSALIYSAFILVLYREGMSGYILLFVVLIAAIFIFTLIHGNLAVIISLLLLGFLVYTYISRNYKKLGIGATIFIVTTLLLWLLNNLLSLEISLAILLITGLLISSIPYLLHFYRYKLLKDFTVLMLVIGSVFFVLSVDYVFTEILEEHQVDRINDLLGIESDPLGAGYNVNQSKIAIGSGGFLGKGFLEGTQTKFNFVPEQSTDFIFCTVGEEWGFVGTTVVIMLFVALLIRLIFLAERQRSPFSRIYGYGVVAILFFHLAINIGMTIGIAPVIGIPLPFFSYGGSSLWAFTILLFVFIRLDASRMELLA